MHSLSVQLGDLLTRAEREIECGALSQWQVEGYGQPGRPAAAAAASRADILRGDPGRAPAVLVGSRLNAFSYDENRANR